MDVLNNYLSKLTNELVAKLQSKKEQLIQVRIKERVGEDIDIVKEASRRFPRISVSSHNFGQEEHWYWNDGSDNGLLLITFYQDTVNITTGYVEDFRFSSGLKYI